MNHPKSKLVVFCSIMLLAACAQSPSGPDYRSELGANGLPTPRALFAKYVDALGGEETVRSHKSTTMTGRFVLESFGLEGSANIYAAAPNSISQLIELPGVGVIHSGYNGNLGWSMDPLQGNAVLEGEMLADMLQRADYYLPLNLDHVYVEQETIERTQVRGNDAYKVHAVDARGITSMLYFDANSGQMVRLDTSAASPIGNVDVFTIFGEHKEFDGQVLPTELSISQAGQEFRIVVEQISFDDVDSERFEVPAQIQALIR